MDLWFDVAHICHCLMDFVVSCIVIASVIDSLSCCSYIVIVSYIIVTSHIVALHCCAASHSRIIKYYTLCQKLTLRPHTAM
jgi:hypothetical protein